jgi:hypothetical protein
MRPYMEDRHTIVNSFQPTSLRGAAVQVGCTGRGRQQRCWQRCNGMMCCPCLALIPAWASQRRPAHSAFIFSHLLPHRPMRQDGVFRAYASVFDGHNGASAADHAADRLHHVLAAESAMRTCTGVWGGGWHLCDGVVNAWQGGSRGWAA